MKRLMVTTIAASALGLFAIPAQAQQATLTAIVQKHNVSPVEAAAAILIADALDIDMTMIFSTSRNTGQSVFVLGPAFAISQRCGVPVPDLWKRNRGRGWGVVAKEMGMHPGDFNKMRVQGGFDNVFWLNLSNQKYGYSQSTWNYARSKGMSGQDAITALVIAGGKPDRVNVVVSDWKKNKGWGHSKAASKGGGKPGGPPAGKGPGIGKGPGNGKGKG